MKKQTSLLLTFALALMCQGIFAQKKQEIPEVKYRRSSLHTVLVQAGGGNTVEIIEGALIF